MLGLTGAQGRWRDLDLTGGLVGLEGRGSTASTEVCSKQVGALGPCGAGAGAIASMVGLLLLIHCDQLEEGGRKDVRFNNMLLHKMHIMKRQQAQLIYVLRKKGSSG